MLPSAIGTPNSTTPTSSQSSPCRTAGNHILIVTPARISTLPIPRESHRELATIRPIRVGS
jgi:hypothetical protein